MSLPALRDAIDLLTSRPALWIPGIACGLLAALIWVVFVLGGLFYAARLLVLALLAAVFLITILYLTIRQNCTCCMELLKGSAAYYFRIVTPTLVIAFGIVLVYLLVILTLGIVGIPPDTGLLTFLTFGVVLPMVMLTFFYDCAVILDDKKVFESIQRSIEIVTTNLFSVILFYLGSFLIAGVILFLILIAWTSALADRLDPLTHYNETQIAAITPEQMMGFIGQDGVIISAVCIFAALTILVPLLYTYKACFYRIISGTTLPIQQTVGEYDSKGRWYKY